MARIARGRRISKNEAAAIAGLAPGTWRNYASKAIAPAPDGYAEVCGCPWWYEGTVRSWRAARPEAHGGRPRKAVAA